MIIAMRHIRRLSFPAILIGIIAAGCPSAASAQSYPSRSIMMIVPFPAGGVIDLQARLLAQRLSSKLGQSVVIDNRPGAGGTIGTKAVAAAVPDGYTLLFAAGSLVIAPSVYKNVGYDPIKSFAPVATAASISFVLVVNPNVPAKTVRELIDYAKANPGKLNYASAGHGTSPHLLAEFFKSITGADVVHVPYKGGVLGIVDVVTGEAQLAIDGASNVLPLIRQGKLRALAVTTKTRIASLPDVPTMHEAGVDGFVVDAFTGVVAPAGTPARIISQLNSEINEALKTQELKARLAEVASEPKIGTPEDFAVLLSSELRKWAAIAKASGATVDR
jgi:tripartite-type tricarboxylate transporter receptor subunit TctC